jgi:hypothetical protein
MATWSHFVIEPFLRSCRHNETWLTRPHRSHMPFRIALRVSLMTLAATASVAAIERASATESPEPVTFPSADPTQGLSVQAGNGGGRPPPGGGHDARPRRRLLHAGKRRLRRLHAVATPSDVGSPVGRAGLSRPPGRWVRPAWLSAGFPRRELRIPSGRDQRGDHPAARRLWRARLSAITAGRGHGSGRAARLVERRASAFAAALAFTPWRLRPGSSNPCVASS